DSIRSRDRVRDWILTNRADVAAAKEQTLDASSMIAGCQKHQIADAQGPAKEIIRACLVINSPRRHASRNRVVQPTPPKECEVRKDGRCERHLLIRLAVVECRIRSARGVYQIH